jgi:starch-binding outer membrane protein, SusD/RagB family
MKNTIKTTHSYLLFVIIAVISGLYSCTKDLDKVPTNSLTSDAQYSTLTGYKQSLVSLYSNLAYGDFLRYYWDMQEYPTDEAVSTWNDDGGVATYHQLAWSADLPAITYTYKSALTTITYCNNFINESSDGALAKRGFTGNDATAIQQFRAEARYLRAYCFWVLMDCYGNPPFPTEESLGTTSPQQIQRKDLFKFIETELKAIEPLLASSRTNEWGRPDKAAAWALLARIYLNAEVYTSEARYTDAITYCNKIISAGYSLESHYKWLMLGDNNLNTNEFIFTINYNNTNQTWVGTNYLALGAAKVPASINGISDSWNEFRFTQQIPALFPSADTTKDKRAQFYTSGQDLIVKDVSKSTDGYSSFKYRNVTRNGDTIHQNNSFRNLSDIDFPVFRLAEIYLTYAEAVLRGGEGGSPATALGYINQLRGRAYANNPSSTSGNITSDQLTIDFILDERGRELYWEAQRRTDLVRYNKLTTSSYLWAWKGGSIGGNAVDSKYNLFPIPTSDWLANPNLDQITGF